MPKSKSIFIRIISITVTAFLLTSCLTTVSFRPKHVIRTMFNISPKSEAPGTQKFEDDMSKVTNTKLTERNVVTPLYNGEEVFPKMIELIRDAKERICFETYIFRNDQTGGLFVKELIQSKQKENTEIYLMSDDVGNDLSTRKFFNPLKKENIRTKVFNPVLNWTILRFNQRDHRKIFTIDGKYAVMSGLNIGNEYNGDGINGFRDTGVYMQGPIVDELDKSFFITWLQGGYGWAEKDLPLIGVNIIKRGFDRGILSLFGLYNPKPIKPATHIIEGQAKARLVTSAPDRFSSNLLDMYLLAINSAKEKVYITTSYFVPPLLLTRALKNAGKRGVDVKIILQGKTDQNFVRQYAINKYGQLLNSGVHIYEWQNSILHSKTIVVDGVWTSIGSCNMDGRSFFLNYEANIAITDKIFALQMEKQFIKDLGNADKINLKAWKKRKWLNKLIGYVLTPLKAHY
jgi:cardiolipin synthase